MNEMIVIQTNENNDQLVSARELHEKLGINKRFSAWFDDQIGRLNLIQNDDYTPYLQVHPQNNQEITDYYINLDVAKHLTMISGGEKAHDIRKYFIEVEKAWNSPEKIMARALQVSNKVLLEYKQQLEEAKPMIAFANKMLKTKDDILVRQFAKVLCDTGFNIGEKKLYVWLRENGYIMKESTEPYQLHVDNNVFVVRCDVVDTPFGVKQTRTTLVTPKGQLKLFKKITGKEFE